MSLKLNPMINLDLTPENDIELSFKRNFNVRKYRELTTNPDYKNLFNPRGFGILLWVSHDQTIFHKNNYHKIIRYFTSFRLSKSQMLYLLENLQLTFNKSLFPYLGAQKNDNELNLCLDFISIKCAKLTGQLNTDIYRQCYLFDFVLIKRNLDLIHNVYDKLRYLESIRADFLQYENFHGLSKQTCFISHCDEEIRKLRKNLKYEKLQLMAPADPLTALPSTPQLKPAEYIQKYIVDKICAIDAAKWKYVFLSEQDFLFFVNLLTDIFSGKSIDMNFSLTLKAGCKTRLCPIINDIYHKFDPTSLRTNTVFLSLLKNISIFEGQSFLQIYKDVIRSRDLP